MSSIHSFSLVDKEIGTCIFPQRCQIGRYYVYASERTNVYFANYGENEVVIIGDCIDLQRSLSDDKLAETIARTAENIDAIASLDFFLGGKYVIIIKLKEKYYLFGDASCSIPINYACSGNMAIYSSSLQVIADSLILKPDKKLSEIRTDGKVSMAMPFDVTIYRDIKQLLPNHYLELNTNTSKRFIISRITPKDRPIDEVVNETDNFISVLTHYLKSKYNLICPITSGRDSRVVMAYLNEGGKKAVECYTQWLDGFNDETQDICLAKRLTESKGYIHRILDDENVPKDIYQYLRNHLGEYIDERTVINAYTIYKTYGSSAIVNGDIIGQVGKCSLHRDIPEKWASAKYFRCKIHNFHKDTVTYQQQWINEIRDSGERTNMFDMFSMENRIGRWAAQENVIYNLVGQAYLNIFNSKCIIYPWTCIDRKLRKKSLLHIAYIKKKDKDLLQIPFEKDALYAKIAKYNGLTYYVCSFVKHWMSKLLFNLKK